jgi:hypothetical protein
MTNGTPPGGGLLTCPTCGRYDTVTVEYSCPICLHREMLPPKPTGHPVTRPCPGIGCGGTENGRVVSCNACR